MENKGREAHFQENLKPKRERIGMEGLQRVVDK
jgi:hypothetical protein